jgi:hypothetical protein
MKTRRNNKRPRKHRRKTRSKKQKGGMNDMSAVYVGAGTDIRPIQFLKCIKTFYYFDGQPFSEFGTDQAKEWKDGKWTGKFTDGFSRPDFIPELDTNMTSINMELINTIDNLRIYSDGNQTVHYYTNTALPEHYEKIKNTIRNFDTLLIAGHDPDSIILDAARNKLHFIGFEDTIFHNKNESEGGPDEPNGVTNKLHIEEITNRFDKYTYVYNNGTQISFDDWSSFYNFYLNSFNHSRRQNGGKNIGRKRKSRKRKQKGGGVGKSKQVEKPDTPPKKTRKKVDFSPDTKSPSSPKQNKTKRMFISKNKDRSKAVVQYENRKREQDVLDMMLGKIPLEGGNKRKNK